MKEIAAQLRDTIDEFFKTRSSVIDWEYKISGDKWSKKEIMGHLIDSAQINLQRFVRCTYQQNFKLIYEQVNWVTAQHYQDTDVVEILALWRLLNHQIIRVIANYPADRVDIQCDTGEIAQQLYTVKWLASDYAAHTNHHLKQIFGE